MISQGTHATKRAKFNEIRDFSEAAPGAEQKEGE